VKKLARDGLTAAGIVMSIILLICVVVVLANPFPFQAFGSSSTAVELPVGPEDFSSALWNLRFWDAIILSLVLLFSAIGCIAIFRLEER
jgi:hypothetical protein